MKYVVGVVSGHGRGRLLGYPTINLEIPPQFNQVHGIYAGWVWLGDLRYKGAFHYGPVPTFNSKTPSLEVFVLDTQISKVPEKITIEMVQKLREIIAFDSQEALVDQISKDVEQTQALLATI